MEEFAQKKIPKIAVVGMDCYLGGGCKGLDAFERSIYEGTQHFISIPPQRCLGWATPTQAIEAQEQLLKNYGFADGVVPLGGYIKDFEIDAFRLEIPPEEVDNFNPQELLMLQVADNALKDAALHKGTRIAIIIAASKELTLHQEKEQLEDKEYPSYIENSLADYISKLWNFAGPTFTLIAEQNSVFKALELGQKLLAIREVDAVLVGAMELAGDGASILQRNQIAKINTGVNTLSYDQNANGWIVGEGAAAVVLKLHDTAKRENNRIYATIDALSLVENSKSEIHSATASNSEAVTQVCQQAFQLADIKPRDINYLEVVGSGIPQQDESEIQGLLTAYRTSEPNLTCAIGSVKANIGNTYAASGIVSLVKAALCLYHRYIPAVPQWSGPKIPEIWKDSPFYVASESKPWFLEKGATRRIAAINGMEIDGSYAHLILSEELYQQDHSSRYLEQMRYYVFAIAADDQSTLLDEIRNLQETIADCSSLSAAASKTFATFQQRQNATYAVAILGHNQDELQREIQHSLKGIPDAFKTGKDWQTPLGSYFTAKPLGQKGKIAFVYPAAFSAYLGIGRNLFRLFPQLYDHLLIKSGYNRLANIEKLVYPRSLEKFSNRQLEALEKELIKDSVAILELEMLFATLLTATLSNYFQIKPQCAFGYSLGEISMMLAQGVWTEFLDNSKSFNSSPLFKTRLSGSKNAVREYWGLPQGEDDKSGDFWRNYILVCPVSRVQEAIQDEDRVYLLLINTPEEVVIAGEIEACKRVIANLNCDAFLAPFTHVIHCEAMRSEYHELVRLNTFPSQNKSETIFYSTAEYKPIDLDSHSIARNIAQNICQQLNFPQLINRVYEDGFKIFIEVGAGSNCSRWIDKTLKAKEQITVSLNKRGVDDHASIIKALAKLLSHRVELDLSPLYSQQPEVSNESQSNVRTITLQNSKISYTPLKKKKQEILQDISFGDPVKPVNQQQYQLSELKEFAQMNSSLLPNPTKSLENTSRNLDILQEQVNFINGRNGSEPTQLLLQERNETVETQVNETWATEQENNQFVLTPSLTTGSVVDEPYFLNLHSPYYQKLSENAARMTKTHAVFLQARQESLKQISAIIQLQIACYQKLFE
ncbi:PfaB family protein [Nostoc sp. NZL]|uniref:PfaB family protein n=1 Tax=Nostoc sp. NZL TaxID=2650612 RepID=UPI0018C7E44D|nr:type I polyketide synthase [Nostoc sp. NZL]MBG1245646.1 type I polyketide synthase [Nostoc sp. NZL]